MEQNNIDPQQPIKTVSQQPVKTLPPLPPVPITPSYSAEPVTAKAPVVSKKASIQNFALGASIVMILLSVLSFIIPGAAYIDYPSLSVTYSYGWFLDLLPMNVVNKIALLLFGIAGLISSRTFSASLMWARSVFVVMGILAILGLFPLTNTLFGLLPLYGTQILEHGVFAVVALYYSASAMNWKIKV